MITTATAPLIFALQDNDSNVRAEAAYSLGVINDSMAVESLIQALKDTIALSEQGGHWL